LPSLFSCNNTCNDLQYNRDTQQNRRNAHRKREKKNTTTYARKTTVYRKSMDGRRGSRYTEIKENEGRDAL